MNHTTDSSSGKLNPVEIKNKEFSKTLWGYSPKEVVSFLDETARAWEQVQRHERELLTRVEELQTMIEQWKSKEAQIDKLVGHAQTQARETLEAAISEASKYFEQVQQKADQIRVKTEEWLERVIREVEETEKKKDGFLFSMKSVLDEHYALMTNESLNQDLTSPIEKLLQSIKQP